MPWPVPSRVEGLNTRKVSSLLPGSLHTPGIAGSLDPISVEGGLEREGSVPHFGLHSLSLW